MKTAGLIFLMCIGASAFGSVPQAGLMVREVCQSNGNPFVQDVCQPAQIEGDPSCVMSLQSRMVTVQSDVLVTGREFRSAVVTAALDDRPYQYGDGPSRWNLRVPGASGSAQISGGNVIQAELYVNHDRSGSTYTRYKCVKLHSRRMKR